MKRLNPVDELANLKSIYGEGNHADIYGLLRDAFATLQARSHVLLSLVTICLTITGFSGPKVAASGEISKVAMVIGLCLALSSGGCLLVGAFDLHWITRYSAGSVDDSLLHIIGIRNRRTRIYRIAMLLLIAGLTSYVASVVVYMLTTL